MKILESETKISVWVDRISEPGKASVIVSREDEGGSTTLKVFRLTGPKSAAKQFARREAKRLGIEAVIESPDRSGNWVAL